MQKLNTPVTKYLLHPNQKNGKLLPDVKEAMWGIDCFKTQEQAKECDKYYTNVLSSCGLKIFVENHKSKYGYNCGKLTWYRCV